MAPREFPVTVMHGNEVVSLTVPAGSNLLMAMVQAGLPVSFFCTTGKCTACRLQMDIPIGAANPISETESYRLGEEAVRQGFRLSCQVYVHGELTVYLTT